jgi:parvulin-like peptidyl-prolyl isomerase
MRNVLLPTFILIIISFKIAVYAQDNLNLNKVVATVGNSAITSEEFLERYEMTPLFRKQIKRITPSLKLEFLYSLIAEKLWAQQAEAMGYDTTKIMNFVNEEFEKMFVRDAMYHREIKDKIKVTDEELIKGYVRNGKKLMINFLFSEDKKEIWNLYKMLNDGVPFDSVLATRPEQKEQLEPEEIVYGQMAEEIEDSLYSLKIRNYTSPLLTPDGWYIFKLTNIINQIFKSQSDKDDASGAVQKVIKARKEKDLFQQFYVNFFKNKKVNINKPLFQSLARKIAADFKEKKLNYRLKDDQPLYLEPEDVLKIEDEIGKDSLQMNYIEFNENPIKLDKFISILAFKNFNTIKYDLNSVAKLLDSETRKVIEDELLAREGIKEGLNYLPEVQKDLKMWKENYLEQMLKNKFIDSAGIEDKEAYNYYLKYYKNEVYPEEVNIIEVLTNSPDTVSEIMNELSKGADIRELASKYSIRDWTKKNRGEFGYFPITSFGNIGKIASRMKVGEIYGPLKVREGYSIFKLIGKRPSRVDTAQPFVKVKDEMKRYLAIKKEQNAINRYTVRLARKYGVDINLPVLEKIKVTNINMFGYRFLGFGGRITAAPLMAPDVDWVEPYLKNLNIAP